MSASSSPHSDNSKYQGHKAEGCRVRVFWEDDNKWYEGTVTRYSESTDRYYVTYDKGGKVYEQLEFLEFLDSKMPAEDNAKQKQPRRSSRVTKRSSSDSSDEGDDDDDYEEEEEEEPTRTRSTRTKKSLNGKGKDTDDSDSSSGNKPKKSTRAVKKRKISDDEDDEEDEEEEDFESEEEVVFKPPPKASKRAKKNDDSESEYEEAPKSTRSRKIVVEDDDEEEDDDVVFNRLDDDEEDEEDDEEDDDDDVAEVAGSDDESSTSDEEFEDRKRKRGRATEKSRKPVKKAAKRARVSRPVKEVTEGVQTILAARRISPSTTTTTTKSTKVTDSTVVEEVDTTTITTSNVEFLVKFRGKSYRNVEWVAGDQLLEQYPSAKIRVRRVMTLDPLPDERPNPEYIIIDRILDKHVGKGKTKNTKYLVKWRGLGYEECTWEQDVDLESDEDMEKVVAYNELEAAAMKRSTKQRKVTKFSKTMDPPTFLGGRELKDFQKEGFLWLAFCWHQKRSSLLADEMGLGKTIQTISLLEYLRTAQGIPGPFLVIAPLSTIENWQREVTDWTGMRALILHGTKICRDTIRKHEWMWPNGTYKFDTLVTSYEIAIAESALIASTQWKVLVVDEAHRIKNQTSKLLSKLVTIKRDHCIMLTGTPLQNDMKELWSLLNFLDPEGFGSREDFMEQYGDLKDSEQVQKLHEQLRPYILRRHKEDVDTTIPVKEETVLEVELSTVQKTYYRAIMEKNREFLGRGMSSKSNLPKLNNIMMQIRKVCNHPFLIPGVEDRLAAEKKLELGSLELLVSSCAKLVLVDKLLTKLREGGHKVLMFSQMVELLDILEEYLIAKKYPYERLDGGVKSSDRQAGIDRFNSKTEDSFVYLLSTRAGGVGINLTAADTVIIYDSDWNPQNDLQAQARCHRIGQTENVKVYRLLSRNTYEQYMFQVSSKKLALGHVVLLGKNGEYDGESDELDKKHVDTLLKYGAYDLFKEDLTEAVTKEKKLQEEDIDSILQRATTITYDTTQPKDSLGNEFNKATFVMSDTTNEIDIDDADFWSKVLPEYKSLEYFRERMSSGAAVASDESRTQFIEELAAYVHDRKENPPNGVLLPGDLLNLLLQIEYKGRFNQEQRNTAKNLRELLEGTRGRRAAAQQSRTLTKRHAKMGGISADEEKDEAFEDNQLSDDNDDVSGSEEDEEGRAGRKKKVPGAPVGPSWNKARRERLKNSLLRFGFGRWETTARAAKVSPDEAQVYTENCVCKLLKNTNAASSSSSTHGSVLNDQYEKYVNLTSERAQRDLVLVPTHSFDSSVRVDVVLNAEGAQDPNHVFTPGDRLQFKLVAQGGPLNFETATDLRLIAMYGSDLVRCYSVRREVVNILAPGFIGQYVWKCVRPGGAPNKVIDCGQSVITQVGCHPMFIEENFDAQIRAPWVKKLSALYILNQLAEEYGPNFTSLSIPPIPAPPLPQWTKEHDKLLLMGVYKHGYGKFAEIQLDDDLGLGTIIDNWVESSPDLRQPTIPMLNKRLYKLLEICIKQKGRSATIDDVEDGEDFKLLRARIRYKNKELLIKIRDIDPFLSIRKPVLKQLNAIGFCRGEGNLVFSYNGFQITTPHVTTPRKLNITGEFALTLTWVVEKFVVEVVWLDKALSRLSVRKSMKIADILGVKYLEPFDSLRAVYNGVTLHPNMTIEEAKLEDNCTITVVRVNDKMRVSVVNPDRTVQHYKIGRFDQFAVFMEQYAKTLHISLDQLAFFVGHRKLEPKRTPEELGLTEKDTITVSIETVLLLVKNDVDTTVEKYTIATKTNLKYLMSKYTTRQAEKGNTNKITFSFQGRDIAEGNTAAQLGIPNNGAILASWDKDQTVVVSLKDYATNTCEEYRVGVDVVLRDLVDTFCADNSLPKNPHVPPRVTFQGRQADLGDTMKTLGVQDKDVVHVVRDPAALKPPSPSPNTLKPIYTIDD